MRVIAGKYKSIKLNTLEGNATRPTTDKVKESLFNMIYCEDKKVLDLFAGSGSLGIEALSRNAIHTIFIDGSISAIKIIKDNLKKCKIESNNYLIYRNDYLRSLKILSKKEEKFDLIFLDPPYKKGLIDISLENILKLNLLNKNAIIVCEQSKDEKINFSDKKLAVLKERAYGSIKITIYNYMEKDSE